MSATFVEDLASVAELVSAVVPQSLSSTANGTAKDMKAVGGAMVTAIQHVGAVTGTSPTLNGKIQESEDGTTGWSDITGAAFTQVTASNNIQILSFQTTKRYLRHVAQVAGTSPSFQVSVELLGQKKISGTGTGYVS